jgi:predicted DNA-binding ArsR family transcriptional regulator
MKAYTKIYKIVQNPTTTTITTTTTTTTTTIIIIIIRRRRRRLEMKGSQIKDPII